MDIKFPVGRAYNKDEPLFTTRLYPLIESTRLFRRILTHLLALEAIAAGAAFRVAVAGIANVDFSQRAEIPRAVILTFRNAATDTSIYFTTFFVHHNSIPP